jgi:hypothetical protein
VTRWQRNLCDNRRRRCDGGEGLDWKLRWRTVFFPGAPRRRRRGISPRPDVQTGSWHCTPTRTATH